MSQILMFVPSSDYRLQVKLSVDQFETSDAEVCTPVILYSDAADLYDFNLESECMNSVKHKQQF